MISSSEAIGYLIFLERIFLPAKLNITISGWLWFQSYTCSKAFPFPIFKSAFHQIRSSNLTCLAWQKGAHWELLKGRGWGKGGRKEKEKTLRSAFLTRQLNRKVSSRTQEEAITRAQTIDMRKYECPSGLCYMLICGAVSKLESGLLVPCHGFPAGFSKTFPLQIDSVWAVHRWNRAWRL